jgi:TRAP-type C4-dicarboxylate transport system substrate-binding protein
VTVPDYTPQYFPSTSMVSIPFLSQNAQAAMQSIYDLHEDYEPAKAIMDRNGLHHVATWPVGRFLLGGHEPIESVAQFQNAQVRVSGPIIQQAIGDQGANIVAVTAPETYEAVERGVVSTIGGAIDFPVNYGIMELLSDWSDPGVGQYSTFGMWVNADAYAALPDDLREQFDQVAEELNTGAGIAAFNEVAAGQCQQMKDAPTVKSLTAWDEQDTRARRCGSSSRPSRASKTRRGCSSGTSTASRPTTTWPTTMRRSPAWHRSRVDDRRPARFEEDEERSDDWQCSA